MLKFWDTIKTLKTLNRLNNVSHRGYGISKISQYVLRFLRYNGVMLSYTLKGLIQYLVFYFKVFNVLTQTLRTLKGRSV